MARWVMDDDSLACKCILHWSDCIALYMWQRHQMDCHMCKCCSNLVRIQCNLRMDHISWFDTFLQNEMNHNFNWVKRVTKNNIIYLIHTHQGTLRECMVHSVKGDNVLACKCMLVGFADIDLRTLQLHQTDFHKCKCCSNLVRIQYTPNLVHIIWQHSQMLD